MKAKIKSMRIAIVLILFCLFGGIGIAALVDGDVPGTIYTALEKGFYLSAEDGVWIRPGLNLKILDISIPADRKPVVTYRITDDKVTYAQFMDFWKVKDTLTTRPAFVMPSPPCNWTHSSAPNKCYAIFIPQLSRRPNVAGTTTRSVNCSALRAMNVVHFVETTFWPFRLKGEIRKCRPKMN